MDQYYNFEDRVYTSPTVSRDEQMSFIDTLRDMTGQENQRIATQTSNLGTNVQSSLGGLTGSEGYFQQRYQTPQMETTVNQLKATAQAKALNDLMSNYEAQARNRYSQAYRNAKRRASTSGSGDGAYDLDNPEEYTTTEDLTMTTEGWPAGTSVTAYGTADGERFYRDSAGNILKTDAPGYARASNGYYYDISDLQTKRGTLYGLTHNLYGLTDEQLANVASHGGVRAGLGVLATPQEYIDRAFSGNGGW